jgi:hypothetical protein
MRELVLKECDGITWNSFVGFRRCVLGASQSLSLQLALCVNFATATLEMESSSDDDGMNDNEARRNYEGSARPPGAQPLLQDDSQIHETLRRSSLIDGQRL